MVLMDPATSETMDSSITCQGQNCQLRQCCLTVTIYAYHMFTNQRG